MLSRRSIPKKIPKKKKKKRKEKEKKKKVFQFLNRHKARVQTVSIRPHDRIMYIKDPEGKENKICI